MKTSTRFFLLPICVVCFFSSQAQLRYLGPLFQQVQITPNIAYGVNATVLYFGQLGEAIPQTLHLDLYEPQGDTEQARPLIILLHSGNFLPPQINGGCNGTRQDASIVALATKLAQQGYVVAIPEYRIGWNVLAITKDERANGLANALYRGVQDVRTCIRYFKMTVAEQGNPYKIDSEKITVWGDHAGAVLSLSAATLLNEAQLYVDQLWVGSNPMIQVSAMGDIEGKTVGIVSAGIPLYLSFPIGDTLCYPNHVDYSSDFQLVVNKGGYLLDSSWLVSGNIPMISFHSKDSIIHQCQFLKWSVKPLIELTLFTAAGSCWIHEQVAAHGNNNSFAQAGFDDPITQAANAVNGGLEGFFPFFTDNVFNLHPWEYASSSNPHNLPNNPDCNTDSLDAHLYQDTILQYFSPRACLALNLKCDLSAYYSGSSLDKEHQPEFSVFPNPTTDLLTIQSTTSLYMERLEVIDLQGRLIYQKEHIYAEETQMDTSLFSPGTYVLRITHSKGLTTFKLLLE